MSNGESYGQMAHEWLGRAAGSCPPGTDPQTLATLGAGFAQLAQAQETARLVQAVGAIARVQVPPQTVPQHEYDEALKELDKRAGVITDLEAQLRIKTNLQGEET